MSHVDSLAGQNIALALYIYHIGCSKLPSNKAVTNKRHARTLEAVIYHQQQKLALGLTCYRVRQFWGDTGLKNDLTSFKQCCSAKLCCDIQLAVIRVQSQFGMYIHAYFFWVISVRFLSWECWDFCRRHDHFRRFPKKSEVCRRRSYRENTYPQNQRSRGRYCYLFIYAWFSFLTWVWVNIFLEIVSSKTATTHIFQSGMRNWLTSVSWHEIEVFNPQAWDSRLRRESWQV